METQTDPTDTSGVQRALARLSLPDSNQCVFAFGEGNERYFCAAPSGYVAKNLPAKVIQLLNTNLYRRVAGAAFGPDEDSWVFVLEEHDATVGCFWGPTIPGKLESFLRNSLTFPSLRVVLARSGSFFAWTDSRYCYSGIPRALVKTVELFALQPTDPAKGTGSWRFGRPVHFTYNAQGAYYAEFRLFHQPLNQTNGLKDYSRKYNFMNTALDKRWCEFWGTSPAHNTTISRTSERLLKNLLCISLNPYLPGECVMIKRDLDGSIKAIWHQAKDASANPTTEQTMPPNNNQGRQSEPPPPPPHRMARALKKGRAHHTDTDELLLKRGEILKVLEEKGPFWVIAENREGIRGWVASGWIEYAEDIKPWVEPVDIYQTWKATCDALIDVGSMKEFPGIPQDMKVCKTGGCKHFKARPDTYGICKHDLKWLLESGGVFTVAFLKQERLRWHPDRFARRCHPDFVDELTKKAQHMFVLCGQLMVDFQMST